MNIVYLLAAIILTDNQLPFFLETINYNIESMDYQKILTICGSQERRIDASCTAI